MRTISSLLGLCLIASCATAPVAVAPQITGLEQFQAPCPDEPPALTDQEANAYADALAAALALPTPEQQLSALKTNVLEPLITFNQRLRRCGLYERTRANDVLALGARYNQILAAQSHE